MDSGDYFEGLADLAQHSLPSGSENLPPQREEVFASHEGRKLHQPGRRVRREGSDYRIAIRAVTQLVQGFEHRIVRFFAAVSFDALPAHDVDVRDIHPGPALERVQKSGLSDSWFPGNKDDLADIFQCLRERLV